MGAIQRRYWAVVATGVFALPLGAHAQASGQQLVANAKQLVAAHRFEEALTQLVAAIGPSQRNFDVSLYLRSTGIAVANTPNDAWSEPFLSAARQAAPLDQPVYAAVLLNDLAGLALRHKQIAAAREHLAAADLAAAKLQGVADGCDVQQLTSNTRALLALEERDYAEGVEQIRRVRALRCERSDPRRLIDASLTSGAIYRQQGDFARGEAEYRSALQSIRAERRFDAAARDLLLAEAHRLLGELLIYDGYRFEEARRELDQSKRLSEARSAALKSYLAGAHLVEIDHFERLQSARAADLEAALAGIARRYGELGERFSEIGFADGVARMTYHRARALSAARQYVEAAAAFTDAADAYGALQDPEWVWRALLGLATQQLAMGRVADGRTSLDRAIAVFESIGDRIAGGEQGRDLFGDSYRRLYERAIDVELASPAPDWQRVRGLAARSRSHELKQNLLWAEDRSVCRDEPAAAAAQLRSTESSTPRNDVTAASAPTSSPNVRAAPSDAVLIEYVVGESGVAISATRAGGEPARSLWEAVAGGPTCISRSALERAVTGVAVTLRATAADAAGARSNSDLAELYDVLVRPVEGLLRPTDAVLFSPSGVLELVPFAALVRRDPDGPSYLVERVRSVAVFTESRAHASQEGAWPWHVSAIVNPRTANAELQRADGDAALQSAEALAADTIHRLFPNTAISSRDGADKQSVWDGLEASDVVHIGAHAQIAEAPFITLSPGGIQGRLTPCEIVSHPERAVRTRLVVLAACQSAARGADFRRDTRLASLAMAFASIGVPNVIGTLWDVAADATSEELMANFYSKLAESRGSISASLAGAQRELARSRSRYSHPYYWAGFMLTTSELAVH